MNKDFVELIHSWPKPYIREQDIATAFQESAHSRYDAVKYAVRKGILLKIRRGLYLIQLPYQKMQYDLFEIAQAIQGPSYISLESALSYHDWIPERVNACTSATAKRSRNFNTHIANFTYSHVPIKSFALQVERLQTAQAIFLIAAPWKAIADHIYVHNRPWSSLRDLMHDMRIEEDSLRKENISNLAEVAEYYSNKKVRKILTKFYQDLKEL